MTNDYLIVQSGEAKILTWNDIPGALATLDLSADIALTAFNPATKTIGLARNVTSQLLQEFLISLLSPDSTLLYPTLQVRIIAGKDALENQNKLKEILLGIYQADNNNNFINIVSADIDDDSAPQSFKLTSFDGQIEVFT